MGRRNNIQNQLQQQQATDRQRFEQQLAQASAPNPLLEALTKQAKDWQTQREKGDFRQASIAFPLASDAKRRANRERVTGLGSVAAKYANPTALAQQKERNDAVAEDDQQARWQQAVGEYDNRMTNFSFALGNNQQAHYLSLLNAAQQQSINSTNQWANYRPPTSPWWGVLQAGIGAAATAYAGR